MLKKSLKFVICYIIHMYVLKVDVLNRKMVKKKKNSTVSQKNYEKSKNLRKIDYFEKLIFK